MSNISQVNQEAFEAAARAELERLQAREQRRAQLPDRETFHRAAESELKRLVEREQRLGRIDQQAFLQQASAELAALVGQSSQALDNEVRTEVLAQVLARQERIEARLHEQHTMLEEISKQLALLTKTKSEPEQKSVFLSARGARLENLGSLYGESGHHDITDTQIAHTGAALESSWAEALALAGAASRTQEAARPKNEEQAMLEVILKQLVLLRKEETKAILEASKAADSEQLTRRAIKAMEIAEPKRLLEIVWAAVEAVVPEMASKSKVQPRKWRSGKIRLRKNEHDNRPE